MNDLVLTEVWRDVKGFEGLYQVSNLGRIKSLVGWNGKTHIKREKIMSQADQSDPKHNYCGRKVVRLKKNGKGYMKKVHRVIAEAFIENPNGYDVVNHVDSNPANNDISNLEWCTPKMNSIHSVRFGNRNRLVTSDDDVNISHLYKNGATMNEIADMYDVSITVIQRSFERTKTRARNSATYRNKYGIDLIELKRLFDMGISNKDISNYYKCPKSLIARRKYQYRKGEI